MSFFTELNSINVNEHAEEKEYRSYLLILEQGMGGSDEKISFCYL